MKIESELAALLRLASTGQELSADERARLRALLLTRRKGRPPRDDLKRFRDEFGRAVAFFIRRAEMGDTAAAERAAEVALTSVRRIRGGVRWTRELFGINADYFARFLRLDAEIAKRFKASGIETLEPEDIFRLACLGALFERFEQMLTPEMRATLMIHQTEAFLATYPAVMDSTRAALAAMPEAAKMAEELGRSDWAYLVMAIAKVEAEAQVQKLAALLH